MSDEGFVRAHWDSTWLDAEDPADAQMFIAIGESLTDADYFPSWSAAAEFTRERLEQIRQLEAEISELDLSRQELIIWRKQIEEVGTPEFAGELAARSVRISRTVARLESALADLKRGMR